MKQRTTNGQIVHLGIILVLAYAAVLVASKRATKGTLNRKRKAKS